MTIPGLRCSWDNECHRRAAVRPKLTVPLTVASTGDNDLSPMMDVEPDTPVCQQCAWRISASDLLESESLREFIKKRLTDAEFVAEPDFKMSTLSWVAVEAGWPPADSEPVS